jgi:urease accessory protein
MHAVAVGAVGDQVGLGAGEVAIIAAQAAVSGPAWAATRLLGLGPYEVAGCVARLAADIEGAAADAVRRLGNPGVAELPAYSAPLIEIGAERHSSWEVQLFAS